MASGKKPGKLKENAAASTKHRASSLSLSEHADRELQWVSERFAQVQHRMTAITNEVQNIVRKTLLEAARDSAQISFFGQSPFGSGTDSSPEEESESR